VQSLVEDAKRGRVMSIFTMAFTGTMPLGNLAIGAISDHLGARATLTVTGIICIIIVLFFFRELPRLRQAAAPVLNRNNSNTAGVIVHPLSGEADESG
jgi:predicted MFS family arabinose efflux permease